MSKKIRLYVLDYPEIGEPIVKVMIPAVGAKIGPAAMLLDTDTDDGDYMPVIFVDNFGRQSKLTYVPVFGPKKIKEDVEEGIESSHHSNSSHNSSNSSRSRSSRKSTSTKAISKNSSQKSHKSKSKSNSHRSKIKSRRLGGSSKNKSQSSDSSSKEDDSQQASEHADIDEDKIVMNFSNARENFDDLKKPLHNKFIKKLKKEFDEKVGGETETLLSQHTQIMGFEVDASDVNLDDFSTEKPDGNIIKIRGKEEEIVFVHVVNEGSAHSKSSPSNDSGDSHDIDFFLSSSNAAGAKEDGKMFLIVNKKNQMVDEVKLEEIETLKDFLEDDSVNQGRVRVTFIDDSQHVMSEPMFVRVVNTVQTDEKFDSLDESAVELNFPTFQKFFPNVKKDVDSVPLSECDRIEDVTVVQDPLLASATLKVDELDDLPIIELIGNDSVVKVNVRLARILRNRLALI